MSKLLIRLFLTILNAGSKENCKRKKKMILKKNKQEKEKKKRKKVRNTHQKRKSGMRSKKSHSPSRLQNM
jgi:hypothetical protein